MRNRKAQGFTLIELLIVIAIIGILAAVLIPNLLSARERAFDTAAQTCLKEIATHEEMDASVDPWEYSDSAYAQALAAATADPYAGTISSCKGVVVTSNVAAGTVNDYDYDAYHVNGANEYNIQLGAGVTHVGAAP